MIKEEKHEKNKALNADWQLNSKISKWFCQKYLENFAPWINFKIETNCNLDAFELNLVFYYHKENQRFSYLVSFHENTKIVKLKLTNALRHIMKHFGMKDAFNVIGWYNFLNASHKFIKHKELFNGN